MRRRLRVGFDLDGVMYDFGNSVLRYLHSIGRPCGWKDGYSENHIWNFNEYWHMTTAEFVDVVNDGVKAGYVFSGPIVPRAVETVRRVRDLGHQVIIVTARDFIGAQEATINWLASHDIEYDELIFSSDKTVVPTDTFAEDRLSNYDGLVDVGTKGFLVNHPWNQVLGGDGRNRINDISEYADAIERITEQGFADLTLV